jgi:hypothetical protein
VSQVRIRARRPAQLERRFESAMVVARELLQRLAALSST